jgi:hypothetical protein
MTDARPALSRTLTLRSASGNPVVRVGVVPAAAATAVALAFFPRLTALAALAALLRRASLSIDA